MIHFTDAACKTFEPLLVCTHGKPKWMKLYPVLMAMQKAWISICISTFLKVPLHPLACLTAALGVTLVIGAAMKAIKRQMASLHLNQSGPATRLFSQQTG